MTQEYDNQESEHSSLLKLPDYSKDFSLKTPDIWLNVASEGPIPLVAKKSLEEAIEWKLSPHLLTIHKFHQVPLQLKTSIAKLLHVEPDDIILGNSATYGLHLLANGLSFKPQDEIVVLQNDFPTDILPWLSLESKGIKIRQLKAFNHVLTVEEIRQAITQKTKLICLPLIHSFSGWKEDIKAIGDLCHSHGIILVVNLSQAIGAFDVDLTQWKVDAVVSAGYKWLLGPYGTGFCWIKKKLREQINYPQNYWISLMDEKSLSHEGEIKLQDVHTARRYDIFGTANFFNYVPWNASIEYLISVGLQNINLHNSVLVDQMIDGLDTKKYDLISPREKKERTNIVVFSCKEPSKNAKLNEVLKSQGIHLALWKEKLRVSPHLYNKVSEIEKLLKVVNQYAAQ